MIREDFISTAGLYAERLLISLKELPSERFEEPFHDSLTVRDTVAELAQRAEKCVRALELLVRQEEFEFDGLPVRTKQEPWKRALASFQIAHGALLAALERVPEERFNEQGDVPAWLCKEYLEPLETVTSRIESWSRDLRARGLGGPTGLPVLK
ncbi:MAG: hypothetical protein H6508_01125 [Calditrichaeota bacterium]|nr:hypothetical protein [Calditrichota bacterium]